MPKCLIYEKLNDVRKSMTVKEENGLMHLSGVFGVCGVMNNNKRVYSKENYKKMVEALQQRIAEEGCPGELEHPNSMNINLERVSHKVDSIEIDEDGTVHGTITLLDTPQGKIAQAIVKGGLPLFVSSRAMGDVDKQGNVTLEMLKTYDLVGTPGFSQAKMHLNEGQVGHDINESLIVVECADDVIENQNENTDMTENEKQELLERIETLEATLESLQSQIQSNNQQICEAVEKWTIEELAPEIQNWIVEHYSPEVEKWIVENYSPEVEKWIVEQFAPEIEKWIVEQYSPEVQKWVIEEYSAGLQKWLFEQYGQGLQDWVTKEYAPEAQKFMESLIEEKQATSKKSKLEEIDECLKMLQNVGSQPAAKKVFESAVKSSNEPLFIQTMPESAKIKWNLASEATKTAITNKARLTRMTNESEIERFWQNVTWEESTPNSVIFENKVIENEWEKQWINRLKRN